MPPSASNNGGRTGSNPNMSEDIVHTLSESVQNTCRIDPELFEKYGVKRGLRNADHSGVLVGLTRIGNVVGYEARDGKPIAAIPGKLIYRGINVEEIVHAAQKENRFGFEETAYLLLSGQLPDAAELEKFQALINEKMVLNQKTTMNIIDLEGRNIMNILARCVLELYTHDAHPDDTGSENLMRQAVELIARFPTIIAYADNVYRHAYMDKTLAIRKPKAGRSIAENFLYMLKGEYTDLEAKVLDCALIIHAEHGGGNNSSFTVRVTSSSGTDTYSSIASGIGSLKGPLHGGANLMVIDQFNHLKQAIKDWTDRNEVGDYLDRILRKEVYDKKGLIYGIGHAVYTISDPRAVLLKDMARELAKEKGREKEFAFLELLEEEAIARFMRHKGERIGKQVCANVDFYSGFVYEMIGLSREVYTPLFAMSRIAGWMAHRIEELNFKSKRIIRPAYKSVEAERPFTPLFERH